MIAEAEGADDKMMWPAYCTISAGSSARGPRFDRQQQGRQANRRKNTSAVVRAEVIHTGLWHVAAKRYLVATDPAYSHKISPGSTRSLKGQGGLYTEAEAAAFLEQPFAAEGVLLRRWDDRAKLPDAKTPAFEYYVPHIERSLKAGGLPEPLAPPLSLSN
jgi:predicted HD phosphohydrolase